MHDRADQEGAAFIDIVACYSIQLYHKGNIHLKKKRFLVVWQRL